MRWIITIVILGTIILLHEFGHFIVAKLNGVAVEEFSVGFGPRLISTVRGGTRYSLKILPLGGSCLMKGMLEGMEDGSDEEEDSFSSKSVGRRMAIIFAGPLFNFLLAFFAAVILISKIGYDPPVVTAVEEGVPLEEGDEIRTIGRTRTATGSDVSAYFTFHVLKEDEVLTVGIVRDGNRQTVSFPVHVEQRTMLGISYYADESKATLNEIVSGSPAEEAGLMAGDVITAVNGTEIPSGEALSAYMNENPPGDQPLAITVERHGREMGTSVKARLLNYVTPGFSSYAPRAKATGLQILKYSYTEVRFWVRMVVQSLRMLVTGRTGLDSLSGPVGIADVIGTTYEESKAAGVLAVVMSMLNLLILLSAKLGVMNLLPVPGLDGGKLLLLIAEAIAGRRVSRRVETVINAAGMIFLLLLMIVVLFNDLALFF